MILLQFLIGLIIGNLFMIIFSYSKKFESIKNRNKEMKKEIEDLKELYKSEREQL